MFVRRIWWIGNIFLVAMLLLSTRIVYWQLVRSNELYYSVLNPGTVSPGGQGGPAWLTSEGLQNLPQPLIQRAVITLSRTYRGRIYDRGGAVLAEDRLDTQGQRVRAYSDPSLVGVIGYTSGVRLGVTGLEQRYNGDLLGLNRIDAQLEQVVHQPVVGSDLVLTIDEATQQAAVQALGDRTGAVIAFDGRSGAILALVSSPHIDPNRVLEPGYLGNVSTGGGPTPLVNRATQGLYPPGSTFKTLTLIAGLDTGQISPTTVFDFGQAYKDAQGRTYYVYRVGGGVVPDPNHAESRLALPMAYAKSANAAFARVGAEMDPNTFISYAQRFGFGAPPEKAFPSELPVSPSLLAHNIDDLRTNDLLRAVTAIGQGELLTSPYNMGLLALAAVNDGNLPVPYLVQSIRDPSGFVHNGPLVGQTVKNLMKPQTAADVRDMMVTGVEQGYGSRAAVAGVTVGGKTGTAQLGGDLAPHAWFLGFAQRGKQVVVIVVLVENGGEGSLVSAPIFQQVVTPALDAASQK